MKRTLGLILIFLLSLPLLAQEITVSEFYLDENDLTANKQETIVLDQNGEKCALIKIITTQTGFTFDVGSLGVQRTLQMNGVIWVYVPQGVRKMSIFHQQIGSLVDYAFPVNIEKARTYVMKLKTPHNNIDKTKNGVLVLNGVSEKAQITLDGQIRNLEKEYRLFFGTYDYKIEQKGFYPIEGEVTINDSINPKVLAIGELKPIMGDLALSIEPKGAHIEIDGKKYTQVESIPLQIGNHTIQVSRNGYKTESKVVEIKEKDTTEVTFNLTQTALFSINTRPQGATLSIDKRDIGVTPCSIELTTGEYEVSATMDGYKKVDKTINFNSSSPDIDIQLQWMFVDKNELYFEGNAGYSSFPEFGVTVGGYLSNFNLELSYQYGTGKSETIYWNGDYKLPVETLYKPTMHIFGKVGYGIATGTRFRITPQIGAAFLKLSEKSSSDTKCANGAYSLGVIADVRFSFAITKHFDISLTPGYIIPAMKSDGFKSLSDVSSEIKGWNNGICAKLGLTLTM